MTNEELFVLVTGVVLVAGGYLLARIVDAVRSVRSSVSTRDPYEEEFHDA